MNRDWTLLLIGIIVVLLMAIWIIDDRNTKLEQENRKLADRQLIIDKAILEGMKCIFDALPRPVNYVEVYDE